MTAPLPVTTPRPQPQPFDARALQLKNTIDSAIERLAVQLQEGHTDEYRQMLRFWSHFHQYSHGNLILIFAQRPDATHVAGYHTWRKLGRQVRQGSQAIQIWCPVLAKIEDPETKQEEEVCTGFRPCPVFAAEDLVDIASNPLPAVWQQQPDDAEAVWQHCVNRIATRYRIKIVALRPGVLGATSPDGRILIAPNLDSRNRVFVLLHELAHQLEHFQPDQAHASKATHELEAESAAMIVAAMFGLDHPTARDYILSYGGTVDDFRAALAAIRRIVGKMVRLLDLEHRVEPAAPLAAD